MAEQIKSKAKLVLIHSDKLSGLWKADALNYEKHLRIEKRKTAMTVKKT